MRVFYQFLVNSVVVATKNNFVWFALTYWAYLETQSVLATSIVGGTFLVVNALSSIWFGSLVDNYKKKHVMLGSNIATLILFTIGFLIFISVPPETFTYIGSPVLWILVVILLLGVMSGSIYQIAGPTLVPLLVKKSMFERANGMMGMIFGISFAITSVASGLVLGFSGMYWVFVIAIVLTIISTLHLLTIPIPENKAVHTEPHERKMDLRGTIAAITSIPGLVALILLTTFNNLLGGVFMALMDAYGLTLVTVQTWGLLWGVLSFGFIFGGLYISKRGLGKSPLKNLFRIYFILWIVTIFFTIQPSIVLLAVGAIIWMSFIPFIEATEQTTFQKVVPQKRLGRVIGFAHSVEQAASPLTAFLIGPIAAYVFIPYMTTGAGVELIGDWFGVGTGRGIALVFITVGTIGLITTIFASRANSFKLLAKSYKES